MSGLRAVIYARCSTEEESQKDALANQVQEAQECVQRKGWILTDSYVESRSGTSTKGRVEYNRLYEELLLDKFDIIVIKSQDRLMRNTRDWYLFIDRLTVSRKKLYIYIEQKFYSTDDALITGIKAILAEDYSRELSKKINNAHHNRQKNGGAVILTSHTYGYKKLPDKSVVLVEEEAQIKRRMYELCAAGYGCRRIAAILRNEGIVNRKGNPFSDADIRRMIRSPLNKGTVVMNRKHYDFDSKRTLPVPGEQQFIYENKVPAIVSAELWELANQKMTDRARMEKRDGKNPGKAPLSGKLFCGSCHAPYYRTVRRKYRDNEKIYEWKCKCYIESGRAGCDNIHLKEKVLYGILSRKFSEICQVEKEKILRKMKQLLQITLQERNRKPELDREERNKEKIKEQMNILVDKLLTGVLSDEVYQAKQKELEQKLNAIQEKIQGISRQEAHFMSLKERIRELEEFMRKERIFEGAYVEGMLEEVERIVIYPRYMELFFKQEISRKEISALEIHAKEISSSKISPSIEEHDSRITVCYGNAFNYPEQKKKDREIIVNLVKENPEITAKQIAEKLDISLSCVNYRIKALKKEGKIHFIGAGGRGRWEVKGTDPEQNTYS